MTNLNESFTTPLTESGGGRPAPGGEPARKRLTGRPVGGLVMAESSRAWRLEAVPLVSLRGLLGGGLLLAMFGAVFWFPLLEGIRFIREGASPQVPEITRGLLFLNMAFAILALLAIPLLYVKVVRPGARLVDEMGLRWSGGRLVWILVSPPVTFGILLVLGGLLFALDRLGLFHEEPSALFSNIQRVLAWDLLLLLPLVSGVTEEVFFRGFLQPRIGLVASSLLFGLAHIGYGTILQVVAPVLLGLFFGLLYRLSRTLWAPIAAHFTFNFVELVVLYLQPPE